MRLERDRGREREGERLRHKTQVDIDHWMLSVSLLSLQARHCFVFMPLGSSSHKTSALMFCFLASNAFFIVKP